MVGLVSRLDVGVDVMGAEVGVFAVTAVGTSDGCAVGCIDGFPVG